MADPEIYKTNKVRFEIMRHFGYFVTSPTSTWLNIHLFHQDPKLIEQLEISINEYITAAKIT